MSRRKPLHLAAFACLLLTRLSAEASTPPAAALDCAGVQRALGAGKWVLLSFVPAPFLKDCGASESCADWAEYLAQWEKAHAADAVVTRVPPASRLRFLRSAHALPPFATLLVARERTVVHDGLVVESDLYAALERKVRGQAVSPDRAAQVKELRDDILRCR